MTPLDMAAERVRALLAFGAATGALSRPILDPEHEERARAAERLLLRCMPFVLAAMDVAIRHPEELAQHWASDALGWGGREPEGGS